ncbi:MAG: 1-(5-phosphoribosyl)-5-[(5-phosphoribosylamino)methylideneamino]imidazole-4-carboxamide isomerase [Candidatus Hodarchaeota archaeon]
MLIIPAVDIREGKCVRLYKGIEDQITKYFDSPVEAAQFWADQGASLIHIIDLDSALGLGENLDVIKKIINQVPAKFEIGGGIRTLGKAEKIFSWGAERIIVGTKAIKEPDFIQKLEKLIGKSHIMVALDYRKDKVLINGWKTSTSYNVFEFAKKMEEKGAGWILFSSAEADGTLTGPNLKATAQMVQSTLLPVIAAGGISSINDIEALKNTKVAGIVTGKAIYEGKLDLKEALKRFQK